MTSGPNWQDAREKIDSLLEEMREARNECEGYDSEAKELLATAAAALATTDGTLAARKARILVQNANHALSKYLEAVKALKEAVEQSRGK